MMVTRGSETSQYPEEYKSIEIPKVVASEMGKGQMHITRTRNKGRLRSYHDSGEWGRPMRHASCGSIRVCSFRHARVNVTIEEQAGKPDQSG